MNELHVSTPARLVAELHGSDGARSRAPAPAAASSRAWWVTSFSARPRAVVSSAPRAAGVSPTALVLAVVLFTGCQWLPQLSPGAATCSDGRVNGAETDVDCGGGSCAGCGDGLVCLADGDCASLVCVASRCAAPSCTDGVLNGDESDVDCGDDCAPCADQQRCGDDGDCASDRCVDNVCVSGSCSDLALNGTETDVDCGGSCPPCATGLQCVRTTDCQAGVCADGLCGGPLACVAPLLTCGGSCVDTRFEHANCGACGAPCGAAEICFDGMCFPSCSGGLTPCPSGCVDMRASRDNCGACGNTCEAGEVCINSTCVFACPQGQTECSGTCFSLDRDRFHCGDCATECPQGTTCVGGDCTPACGPPLAACDGGLCVDPANDPQNCGGCGIVCTPPLNAVPTCTNGTCGRGACLPGFDDCDGQDANGCETDLSSSSTQCGGCGRTCVAGDMCNAGRCCGAPPPGSYTATCNFCEACDGLLSCICEDGVQNPVPTSIPLNPPCPETYTNCNGMLTCGSCP